MRHGKTHTAEYKIWCGIKQRCTGTQAAWAEEIGCSQTTFLRRIRLGWSLERILTSPVATRWRKR